MPSEQPHQPKQRNGDQPDQPDESDQFGRFEDLTRRLLRVPKSELDKKRKAEARSKAKRNPKTV